MKTKVLVLSLLASALVHAPTTYARDLITSDEKKVSRNALLEFYPVKVSKMESKDGFEFNGAYLLPLTKKPVVTLKDFSYEPFSKDQLGIKLYLDAKDTKALNKATQKYSNTRLAVIYNGQVLAAPVIKSAINSDQIHLAMLDQRKFEDVIEGLEKNTHN